MEEINGEETMVIEIKPRKNAKLVCRVCMQSCGTHATERPRQFEYGSFWQWKVYFQYAPRCAGCAVVPLMEH